MFLKIEFTFRYIILLYYFCSFLIKSTYSNIFIDIKKLNLYDSYFVVLDSGFYLYNFKTLDCSFILGFNSTVYRDSGDNKIILDELHNEKDSLILCLVNQFLFIFNEKYNKTFSYKIEDNVFPDNTNFYYNLLPYKIKGQKISFIIVSHKSANKLPN